jgi:hypothetical protein
MISRKFHTPVQVFNCRGSIFHALVRLVLLPVMFGLLIGISAMAQSAGIIVGSAPGIPGASVTVPISFTAGATGVSTLQFDLIFSSLLTYSGTTSGPAATAAEKSVSSNAITGGARILVFGLNQNSIGSGVIANLQLNISGSAPAGTIPITITGIVASDALANAVSTIGTAGGVIAFSPSDTTPPVISGVTSSNLSATGATITWTTNEASDSQIEYGTTIGYGSSTSLDSSMVVSHLQSLTSLTASTLYHYRVKSKDAAGNPATSADYTFTTTSTTESGDPPVITDITVTDVTSKSATISWSTDKSADSEVEYWDVGLIAKTAALRNRVTAHSLTLNQLKRQTEYTFLVKSTDSDGQQTVASELTFTTAEDGGPALVFPRFSGGRNVLGPDTMSGIGLANMALSAATVTFTAVEENGSLTAGPGIQNPVSMGLNGKEQRPLVDSVMFGNGILDSNSNGYIKLESSNEDTSGFFLIFDGDLNFQDGANLSDTQLRNFIFSEIQADGYNKISIINNNPDNADLVLELVDAYGAIRSSVSRSIAGHGSLTADLFSDLFIGFEPNFGDYVRVQSSIGVQSFQVMRQKSGDMAMLAGQDLTAGGTVLYSPLYAFGGPDRTSLSVVNLDSIPGTVTLRFISGDGFSFNTSRVLPIAANGKLYIDDPQLFMALNPAVLTTGYVEVVGNGVRLAGSTVLRDIHGQSFIAALALISNLQNSVLFSHVASNDVYFTGICILNPGSSPATVKIDLYTAQGALRESKYLYIGARQRQSRLLSEYFSSLNGQNQTSGYVRLYSEIPIASFAAFGTNSLSMISAIPPQNLQ